MNHSTLEMLLEVLAPWNVVKAEFDPQRRQLEVHIAMARTSWFGAVRPIRPEGARHFEWRHLALSGHRVLIKLDCPAGMRVPEAPWAGAEDSPFSHALSHRLLMMFDTGASLPVVSTVLDLEPQEVWRFRRRLDTGKLGAGWQQPETGPVPSGGKSPNLATLPAPRAGATMASATGPLEPPESTAAVDEDSAALIRSVAETTAGWTVDPLIQSFFLDLPSPPALRPATAPEAPAVLELPDFDYAAWEAECAADGTKRKVYAA